MGSAANETLYLQGNTVHHEVKGDVEGDGHNCNPDVLPRTSSDVKGDFRCPNLATTN